MNRTGYSTDRRILVLCEGWDVRRAALQYAGALAQRTGSELVLLMLLPISMDPSHDIEALREQSRERLHDQITALAGTPRFAEHHVRVGDPWSELCKYLATSGRFQMVVWAGEHTPSERPSAWPADHWLSRVQRELGFTVIVAKQRWKAGDDREGPNHDDGGAKEA
jgi:nucleotide-binding universal stress UspA family protein